MSVSQTNNSKMCRSERWKAWQYEAAFDSPGMGSVECRGWGAECGDSPGRGKQALPGSMASLVQWGSSWRCQKNGLPSGQINLVAQNEHFGVGDWGRSSQSSLCSLRASWHSASQSCQGPGAAAHGAFYIRSRFPDNSPSHSWIHPHSFLLSSSSGLSLISSHLSPLSLQDNRLTHAKPIPSPRRLPTPPHGTPVA